MTKIAVEKAICGWVNTILSITAVRANESNYKQTGNYCTVKVINVQDNGQDFSVGISDTKNIACGVRDYTVSIHCYGEDGFSLLNKLDLMHHTQISNNFLNPKKLVIVNRLMLRDLPYLVNDTSWIDRAVMDLTVRTYITNEYTMNRVEEITVKKK